MSRVKLLAGFQVRKVGDARIGESGVDIEGPVPGQVLVRVHSVVLDPVGLRVRDEVEGVGDLLQEQPLVLQRAEPAFA